MISPIVFFASILFGASCVHGDHVYNHKMGFPSLGQFMTIHWSDDVYELKIGQTSFQFGLGGDLETSFVGSTRFTFDDYSTPCNVPAGISKDTNVDHDSTYGNLPFTMGSCSDVLNEACENGIAQLCDYALVVSDNKPPFNNWADYSFSNMCRSFYSACQNGRAFGECEVKCSDPEVYDHLIIEECPVDEECVRSLEVSLTWTGPEDLDLRVTEPNSNEVYYTDKNGDYGFLDMDSLVGGTEVYAMYGDLSGSNMLGDYDIKVDMFGTPVDPVNWTLVASSNGVDLATYSGTFDTYTDAFLTTYSVVAYDDNDLCLGPGESGTAPLRIAQKPEHDSP